MVKRIWKKLEDMAAAVAYAEEGRHAEALELADALVPLRRRPEAKVILGTQEERFSEPALAYMAGLLERMPCHVLALSPAPGDRDRADGAGLGPLARMADARGTLCLHRTFTNGLCRAVRDSCGLVRDVRFAVIQDPGERMASCPLPIPVFRVEA